MQAYYPPNTYIKCVLVGGVAHGKNWLKSPEDAHAFKLMIPRPLPLRFFEAADPESFLSEPEVVYYEPFAELSFRARIQEFQFIRLFAPDDRRGQATGSSFLQIADALRIAGIDSL